MQNFQNLVLPKLVVPISWIIIAYNLRPIASSSIYNEPILNNASLIRAMFFWPKKSAVQEPSVKKAVSVHRKFKSLFTVLLLGNPKGEKKAGRRPAFLRVIYKYIFIN